MGDPFDAVFEAMGPVIERVDAPLVTGAVMVSMLDAIHQGVAHQHIVMGHVDLGPQDFVTLGKFTGPHAAEQVEVLSRSCDHGMGY